MDDVRVDGVVGDALVVRLPCVLVRGLVVNRIVREQQVSIWEAYLGAIAMSLLYAP